MKSSTENTGTDINTTAHFLKFEQAVVQFDAETVGPWFTTGMHDGVKIITIPDEDTVGNFIVDWSKRGHTTTIVQRV